MCNFYNKIRKNLLIICPILNLQWFKDLVFIFIFTMKKWLALLFCYVIFLQIYIGIKLKETELKETELHLCTFKTPIIDEKINKR